MRLERLFTHRLIRVLRVVIPVLVVVLIAIPAWNYIARRADRRAASADSEQLPRDLAVRTEGFTFSQTEGGRTLFTIRAARNLGFKDNRNMLEDVEVIVYGATEAEPTRRIRSARCSYDQETGDIRFEGNVEVQLDDRTTARSEELTYNHRDRLVASSSKTFLDQPGAVTAEANAMEYHVVSRLLKLNGDVRAETADKTRIETDSVVFNQQESWATMTGGVSIRSAQGWVRGMSGRADLQPLTYQPKTVSIDEAVTGELQAEGGRRIWKLSAGWIQTVLTAAGNAEKVFTRANVVVEEVGGDSRKLTGDEVDANLNAAGSVDIVEARGNAELTFGADRSLRSNQIWSNAAGSVETTDKSELRMGDAVIQGSKFTIQTGDIITFNTPQPATLRSSGRESSANETRARFDRRNNTLIDLTQTGNFRFKDARYEGHAQNARFEDGGNLVTLSGSPVVNDVEKRLEAGEIQLNQKSNAFVATKNVRTFFKNDPDPLVVKAERACRGAGPDCKVEGADALLYTGNVELWRGRVHIKSERLQAGTVGKTNQLQAEGKVQSNFGSIRASSDRLDYDDARGVAHYTGHVRAQKQDMILETPDMAVTLRDNDVARIVASGGVEVWRANQRGSGETAVYDAATDTIVVTGNAKVRDAAGASIECTRLTMRGKADSAVCQGAPGKSTVTKYPIKK